LNLSNYLKKAFIKDDVYVLLGIDVNDILKVHLLEVAPLGNEDAQVFEMCRIDLRNYIKYLEHKYPEDNSQKFYEYMRGRALGEYWEEYYDEEMEKTMTQFLQEWCMVWWKKFQQRTELTLKRGDDIPKAALELSLKGRNSLIAFWTQEEREELEEYIVNILYDAGEYVCSAHLAHSLIEQYLGRDTWQQKKAFTQADKLEFMHVVGVEARRMSYSKGKLIFIRSDFKKYLREWRNDNAQTI
jgi:hypothetical protein